MNTINSESYLRNNRQSGLSTIAEELCHSSGTEVSDETMQREVIGLGFHGRATPKKTLITRTNAHLCLEWCKQRRHSAVEQWKKGLWSGDSLYVIWHSN